MDVWILIVRKLLILDVTVAKLDVAVTNLEHWNLLILLEIIVFHNFSL